MSAKSSAEGNFRIELDQVAVGRAVSRDDLADRRNGRERVSVVGSIEDRQVDLRELEAQELSAVPEHAEGLRERLLDPGDVADAEGDRVGVESAVAEGQVLGVGLDERHTVFEAASFGPFGPNAQHVGVDVGDRHAGLAPPRPRDAEGDVAGAACDVQMVEWARRRRTDLGGQNVLPDAMQAERHQIVHHVVAVGDLVEHRVHQTLLLRQAHLALAKMRVLGAWGHLEISVEVAVF